MMVVNNEFHQRTRTRSSTSFSFSNIEMKCIEYLSLSMIKSLAGIIDMECGGRNIILTAPTLLLEYLTRDRSRRRRQCWNETVEVINFL